MIGSFRLFLAAMVVASHTRGSNFFWVDPGLVAVALFFVISGYLMPATFEMNYAGRGFLDQTRRYLLNRFWRVFPIYWLVVLMCLVVLPRVDAWKDQYVFTLRAIVHNLTLIGLNQDWFWRDDTRYVGAAWTLDIEVQFYLVVPLLVWMARNRASLFRVLLVFFGAIGTLLWLTPTGVQAIDRSLIGWFPFFAAGLVLYLWKPRLLPSSTSSFDKLLGDLSYPLFLVHTLVIQTGLPDAVAGSGSSYWLLLVCNLVVSLPVSYALHSATANWVNRLRSHNRSKPAEPCSVPELAIKPHDDDVSQTSSNRSSAAGRATTDNASLTPERRS